MDDPQSLWRRRRVTMQVLLLILLAGTVGMAALVNRTVTRPQRLEGGGVAIQLPPQWRPVEPADGRAVISAIDPARGREMLVVRMRVGPGMGAGEHLRQSGLLSPDYRNRGRGIILDQGPIRMAGQTGLLVIGQRNVPAMRPPLKELIASVILPDQEAVTIILVGPGSPETADVMLIQQVAASLVVSPRT